MCNGSGDSFCSMTSVIRLLVEQCRRGRAEAVAGVLFVGESNTMQCCVDRVVADRSRLRSQGRKEKGPVAGDRLTDERESCRRIYSASHRAATPLSTAFSG